MNTRITYEYRDGANYRFHNEVVVGGEMTPELWQRIRNACEDRELFIAHQVRLPEVFGFLPGAHIHSAEHRDTGYKYDEENDHCWHRFGEDSGCWELTSQTRTDRRSVLQLVCDFERAAKTPWRVFDPAERFGF